jgi:predicted alpha-1,2-mannosidase
VVVDLEHRDYVMDGNLLVQNNSIAGYRISKAWAEEQHYYFSLSLSTTPDSVNILKSQNGQIRAVALYFPIDNRDIFIAAQVSFAGPLPSPKTAPNRESFALLKTLTELAWEKQLSKITVKGTPEQENIFYTALYHTMIVPNGVSDPDGTYRGMDLNIHNGTGEHYSVFSLWDTYRATHPLYTLIEQQRTRDFMKTFLRMFRESGRLPVWELAANETNCMIGYHAVSVIADAMAKGIMPDSAEALLEAAVRTAQKPVFGLDDYMNFGFLSMENESESVSKTLEYAYNDWCIAQMAKMLGKDSLEKVFLKRSEAWKNVFDPKTGHMRPRSYGRWLEPFNPKEVNNHYTEANSWHYSFSVPHDMQTWMGTMISQGKKTPEAMLDSLFTTTSKTTGREQADITGMIGQYAHGNEPSHHIAYLYNSVGKPHKTQQRIKQILETQYRNSPDGLSGNEDCGQMSAWYVLSSMGFYPVCPGDARYSIGYPLFKQAILSFENGKKLQLLKKGKGHYIRRATLNGKAIEANYLLHKDIIKGGKLVFTMAETPTQWGSGDRNSFQTGEKTYGAPAPVLYFKDIAFEDSMAVKIKSGGGFEIIISSKNKPEINMAVRVNDTSIVLKESCCLSAAAKPDGSIAKACFVKRPNHWKVKLLNPLHPQYTGGGDQALCNGIAGDPEWQKGNWQGIQGQPFEAIIDLVDTQSISSLNTGFLQDTRSWIVFPRSVSYSFSLDGQNWFGTCGSMNKIPIDSLGSQKQSISTHIKPVKARYVKMLASQHGTLPAWHPGAGGETFIFVDELEINK